VSVVEVVTTGGTLTPGGGPGGEDSGGTTMDIDSRGVGAMGEVVGVRSGMLLLLDAMLA